ncbi:recombinase family protein [Tropicibacter sp. R15_0]|uniref:recombinase family protein n=1 Tax=Tropicibacter sp. R15_0 TaxID=2821101 RepID=UPI001ADC4339|nr:recombinase family protein [Tropicibacter sp. R15_0]MBO9466727.1 recombinase family protein [Tropicibacter sp. R15_0]
MNQKNSPDKAVIYCRVSSRAQETEGHGLTGQETRCREYASSKGYDVVAVFPDTISGGLDFMKRPGMVALLSFLEAQPDEKFVVIFDDPKRFARSTRFHLDLREALRKRGASIECLNFKFEEDSPEGEFIETIIAAQGELERKQNGRQVGQKMKARMQNGFWIHNPPIGYRYETHPGRGKVLVPNPPFDSIIREAFHGFASGRFQTQAEVMRFFESFPDFPRNKHGQIKQQRVTDILTQPVYTGHICSETYGIKWLKAQHEPLISLETFEKVQERRDGAAYAPKRKNIGDEFALRGIAVCGGCNVPLRSSLARGKMGKRYPYYLCQTKTCDHYGKSIRRDVLEGEVGKLIKDLQPSPGLIALARAMFRKAWDARDAQAKTIRAAATRQIKAIEKETATLLNRIMGATNTQVIAAYETKLAEMEKEKAILAEKRDNQIVPTGTFEEKLEPLLLFLSNPLKLWDSGSVFARRAVLKLAFADRITYDRINGPRTPEMSFLFKALSGLSGPFERSGAGGGT